jgi:hypothetical protein
MNFSIALLPSALDYSALSLQSSISVYILHCSSAQALDLHCMFWKEFMIIPHIHITQYPCIFPHQTSALATHQTSDEFDKLLQIIENYIRLQITNNRLNPKFIIQ